jgi:methyl halide transferase
MEKNAIELNHTYWDKRYVHADTGWDLKMVSPPIKAYIDQLTNKHIAILIPGCGHAYEAAYLYQQGFTNITIIDIAPTLIHQLKIKFAGTGIKILQQNIFSHVGQYNLIIEQTLFCAIHPSLRPNYVQCIHTLLHSNGKYVGVLFNKIFEAQGPPFGGNKAAYINLFKPYFTLHIMDECYNSITPRAGAELFIRFSKK